MYTFKKANPQKHSIWASKCASTIGHGHTLDLVYLQIFKIHIFDINTYFTSKIESKEPNEYKLKRMKRNYLQDG
jgi:hypothetical protein